jgi:hypothetical protein
MLENKDINKAPDKSVTEYWLGFVSCYLKNLFHLSKLDYCGKVLNMKLYASSQDGSNIFWAGVINGYVFKYLLFTSIHFWLENVKGRDNLEDLGVNGKITLEWWEGVDLIHVTQDRANVVRVIKSRRMRWAGHVARMGDRRGVYRVLAGRPEGKRPLGRPRHRWEDNIKMDLRQIGIDGANWILLAQDRDQWRAFVSMVVNLCVT